MYNIELVVLVVVEVLGEKKTTPNEIHTIFILDTGDLIQ